MSKMGLYDPFGWLKHQLWSKERLGVTLPISPIWFPTTKSQESPWLSCVRVLCHIPLESSQQGLQLCFKPHFNRRFTHKVMCLQSRGSPRTKWHLGVGPMTKHIITIKGKVIASPKSGLWWVLWIHVWPSFVRAPKVF
jgi:hypothetical protein